MRRSEGASGNRNPQRIARAEAAAWIVRLHGPHRSPELEAAFRDWLSASSENAQEFERVTEVWEAGASTPLASVPRRPPHWKEPTGRWGWAATLAAMVIVAALGGGWTAWHHWVGSVYTTNVGEQRIVRLNDGSRVSLSSGTRVRVWYGGARRRVDLQTGEAYFEVVRDAHRPFIVTAGSHEVTALGTMFDIRQDASLTAITLVEGEVSVESKSTRLEPEQPIVLSPGKRLRFFRDRRYQLDHPPLDAITAWRRGEVILDRTPLAEAVMELNRYDQISLVVADPLTAALPISGIFRTGDSRGFAQAIAKLYGLELSAQANRIELRAARSKIPSLH